MDSWTLALVAFVGGLVAALFGRHAPKFFAPALLVFSWVNVWIGASTASYSLTIAQQVAVGASIVLPLLFAFVRWFMSLQKGHGPQIPQS